MRQQQEQRLVRVDNGEKELDRQGADLMLKVRACSLRLCVASCITHLLTIPPMSHRFAQQSQRKECSWSSSKARANGTNVRLQGVWQIVYAKG